jgi:hypothetical protein
LAQVRSDLSRPLHKLRLLEGNLIVQSSKVTRLDGLNGLMTVGGDVVVFLTHITDLSGLERCKRTNNPDL